MHEKDFTNWGKGKETIHYSRKKRAYPKEREIWYVKMGINIGNEEDGKKGFLRPVLVVKKFGTLLFCMALTSKGKDNHYFYHTIKNATFNKKNQKYKHSSYGILSQVKTIDTKRFTENMEIVDIKEFLVIKNKLKAVLL